LLVDFYIDTWAGRKGNPYLDSVELVSIVAHTLRLHQPNKKYRTYLPISVRIIHRYLVASLDTLRHQHNPLSTHPHKPLILAVWLARVIDKTCVIALPSLPNLVRIRLGLSNHDIEARQTRRDLAHEFAHCGPAIEGQACDETVITPVWCAVDLYGGDVGTCLRIQIREAIAAVLWWVVRLAFVAYLADVRVL
jgi:hypothetical protein